MKKSEFYSSIKLPDNDKDLLGISLRLNLGLSLEEIRNVKTYFQNEGRNPTDVELQAIAQAWSEHCGYKSSKIHLKKYIMGIAKEKVFHQGDAGMVSLDDDIAVAFKMESHNHPSAIEPYGGAATGVGGILRDILSMGAEPIAVTDMLYFGTKSVKGFPDPKFIETGVIAGIRDYGNRVGIPTVSGGIFYSDFFSPNVLVNVGCVGVVQKNKICSSEVSLPGIKLILAGGKTGRDGIHGVNMASATIEKDKEDISTVQLGSPITKEPLIHAVLEANDKGLIYALKDLGGGGLSSVVGEMFLAGGVGGSVHLENVPLKESNMLPWEIWISESQERMLLAVKGENVQEVLQIMDNWDLASGVIGESHKEKRVRVYYKKSKVLDLDGEFLTSSPLYERKAVIPPLRTRGFLPKYPNNLEKYLLKMISDPNIRTKEFAVRQYDHTVRGSTTLGPFSGIVGREGPTDASVIIPSWEKTIGVAIAHGANPFYSEVDPYLGALSALDESVRNLISVGAVPLGFSDCLNAGNPEDPEIMGEFIRMVQGLGTGASFLEIPFVSGNVSFYNESGKRRIPTFPTIMAVGKVDDVRSLKSPDFKKIDNPIYIVGNPTTDLGGSLYYRILRKKAGLVPKSDVRTLKRRGWNLIDAIQQNMIRSVHDVSEGGIGVAVSEMTIGSGMGAELDLSRIGLRPDFALFSEPQATWVVEVERGMENEFVTLMKDDASRIGIVSDSHLKVTNGEEKILSISISKILKKWKEGYN